MERFCLHKYIYCKFLGIITNRSGTIRRIFHVTIFFRIGPDIQAVNYSQNSVNQFKF